VSLIKSEFSILVDFNTMSHPTIII